MADRAASGSGARAVMDRCGDALVLGHHPGQLREACREPRQADRPRRKRRERFSAPTRPAPATPCRGCPRSGSPARRPSSARRVGVRPVMTATTASRSASAASAPSAPVTRRASAGSVTIGEMVPSKSVSRPAGSSASASRASSIARDSGSSVCWLDSATCSVSPRGRSRSSLGWRGSLSLSSARSISMHEPTASLPPFADRDATPIAEANARRRPHRPRQARARARAPSHPPAPTPSPLPSNVTAVQLEVPSVGINVRVFQPTNAEQCGFPPSDGAYLLCRTDADDNPPAGPPAGTQHEFIRLCPRPERRCSSRCGTCSSGPKCWFSCRTTRSSTTS